MEYTDAGSPRIGSGAAGQPLAHLFQQQSVASMNSSGTKVNHPLGKLKELLFAFTSSQPVLTCIADPILHEMWPQLGPFIPSYCSEFFLKACNALLPWPQFSLLRKGCKEWIAFFSCYLDKDKSMLIKVRPCLCQTCLSKRFRKPFFTLPSCEISHLASRPQPIDDGFGRCSRTLEAAFQRHSRALARLHTLLYTLAPPKNGTHFK